MNHIVIKSLSILFLFISSSFSIAGPNNGYTSATNVYTGSASRTWYGGGVAFVLSEWKKEKEKLSISVEPAIEEQPTEEQPLTESIAD